MSFNSSSTAASKSYLSRWYP